MRCYVLASLAALGSVSALQMAAAPARATVCMQETQATPSTTSTAVDGRVVPTTGGAASGWQLVVGNAQKRAATVKADQDATAAAMATGFLVFWNLPLPVPVFADVFLSTAVAGILGVVAGFREDFLGDAARTVGKTVSSAGGAVAEKLSPATEALTSKLPGAGGEGLSMSDIKKCTPDRGRLCPARRSRVGVSHCTRRRGRRNAGVHPHRAGLLDRRLPGRLDFLLQPERALARL